MYALLGNYDYSKISETTGVKFKSLGISKFGLPDNLGKRKNNYLNRIVRKMFRMTLEFPNIELFWMTKRVLKDEGDIDYLITVYPHTIHWGASNFVKENKSKIKFWVADCGDPYMGNPFHRKPFYFKYIEKWFCRKTDFITIPIEEARKAYYAEFQDKIKVIPQGFDFEEVEINKFIGNDIPTFLYAGVFYTGIRDPRPFLDLLCNIEKDFRFIIYTKSKSLLEKHKEILKNKLIVRDYIPRNDLIKVMSQVDFLVNFENNSTLQSPSKLIDYTLSNRPVLSLNSNKELDRRVIEEFLNGNYKHALKMPNIQNYNIQNVVQSFIKLINFKHK